MSKAAILPTYHPISHISPHYHHISRRNSFEEVSDLYIKTKKFGLLSCATLALFLFSLWAVAEFSGSGFNIHRALRYHNKNNEAAIAAASVMGEGGEEGIHGLEVENHGRISLSGHNHGVHEPIISYLPPLQGHQRILSPNIAKQRFEEALKNDLNLDDYYDSEPLTRVELEIDDLVHENPVVIFSKSYCLYSRRAKHIFSLYRIYPNVVVVEVDNRDDAAEVKEALTKFTYRNTFPNIFIDGRSIGGSDELALMHTNGRLKEMLIEAGVLDDSDSLNSRPAL